MPCDKYGFKLSMNIQRYTLFGQIRSSIHALPFVLLLAIDTAAAKEIIGLVENVRIDNSDFILAAKMDTGARNSSLNVPTYQLLIKGKETWVKFDITNGKGKTLTLEKRISRHVKIKRKEASTQQRMAILLDICIGNVQKQMEVNLVNRSNFNYRMLIGRSFFKGNFLIDVDKSYTVQPSC